MIPRGASYLVHRRIYDDLHLGGYLLVEEPVIDARRCQRRELLIRDREAAPRRPSVRRRDGRLQPGALTGPRLPPLSAGTRRRRPRRAEGQGQSGPEPGLQGNGLAAPAVLAHLFRLPMKAEPSTVSITAVQYLLGVPNEHETSPVQMTVLVFSGYLKANRGCPEAC